MREITSQCAADYLRWADRVARDEPIEVRELAGGVSNVVLLVTLPRRGGQFVLKQARGQLRVKEEWLCPVERIWREVEVLRICGELLQVRSAEIEVRNDGIATDVPRLLWEDRDNFVYAMTAAPAEHRTWKEILLSGETSVSRPLAIACGRLLGQLHAGSWASIEIAGLLDDRTYFDQLRLDPYYRHVARVHADLGPDLERLIDSIWQHRLCLVHGDFSPKNLLVWPGHLLLIDFEVGHYGDPAFDLGFFLTHLVLKSIWAGERQRAYVQIANLFWDSYRATVASSVASAELTCLEERMVWNLAGCLLARVDGKSPVDYLSAEQQRSVREAARRWVASPPRTWNDFVQEVPSTRY
jgi:thiamine kinase-like enzyme